MKLSGKRVLVIGLGESGLAMARWVSREGALVRVVDSRAAPPNQEKLKMLVPEAELICGGFLKEAFESIDLMAMSPGVSIESPEIQAEMALGIPLVSEIELFAFGVRCYAPTSKILGITGSNGKTTTTALTAHLLNAAGISACACGNISPSALDALMNAQDSGQWPAVWVLELSSFQLEATFSLAPDAATILNISEDHLDRYTGMPQYIEAKAKIFKGAGFALLNRDDPCSSAWGASAPKVVSFGLNAPTTEDDYGIQEGALMKGKTPLLPVSDLPMAGLHNAANTMAALALCEAIGIAPTRLLAGLRSFKGLAHRVERVADIKGVTYFDDSKGTNVGATSAALRGLKRKVVLILGGEGKSQDFRPLARDIALHARAVALIGRDAKIIHDAIGGADVPMCHFSDLETAVRWCQSQAEVGDAVLLSPACASFDMFQNYAHRAEVFVNIVHQLMQEVN